MKKLRDLISVLFVIGLMVPLASVGAEKAPVDATVAFYNRTGAPVSLSLIGEDGLTRFFDVPIDITEYEVPEGVYTYYASTACGVITGQWNFTNNKRVVLTCEDAIQAHVTKMACDPMVFYVPGNWFEANHMWWGELLAGWYGEAYMDCQTGAQIVFTPR